MSLPQQTFSIETYIDRLRKAGFREDYILNQVAQKYDQLVGLLEAILMRQVELVSIDAPMEDKMLNDDDLATWIALAEKSNIILKKL